MYIYNKEEREIFSLFRDKVVSPIDGYPPILRGEDFNAYNIIRSILEGYIDEELIRYKSYKSCFSVVVKGLEHGWVIKIGRNKDGRFGFCLSMDDYSDGQWDILGGFLELKTMSDKIVGSLMRLGRKHACEDAVGCEKTANTPQLEKGHFAII